LYSCSLFLSSQVHSPFQFDRSTLHRCLDCGISQRALQSSDPIFQSHSLTSSLSHNITIATLFSNTIPNSRPLTAEKPTPHITQPMHIQEQQQSTTQGMLWSIPDIQVLLFFILLCCFAEGIGAGYTWCVISPSNLRLRC
jgi:hypothetical protein